MNGTQAEYVVVPFAQANLALIPEERATSSPRSNG
jgi:threonine dehydrogenase-like Zn-dependent dehydrogenase